MNKLFFILTLILSPLTGAQSVTIGSKNFTESYILAELLAQTVEDEGGQVRRVFGVGGTGMVYEALRKGEIDAYVEYTGTISEVILRKPRLRSIEGINKALRSRGLVISDSLGFNNTYALATRREFAITNRLHKISDLRNKAEHFRFAFSYEFMARTDGFEAMKKHYRLPLGKNVRRMDHALVYEALNNKQVDIVEVYSTDAKINKMDLTVLEDDEKFFPAYHPVILATQQFVDQNPALWSRMNGLAMTLDEEKMRQLNAEVDIGKKPVRDVVSVYLDKDVDGQGLQVWPRVWQRTKEHFFLVSTALVFSIFLGVPLGVWAASFPLLGQGVLAVSGLLQTIPSLAMLVFLIPFLGVGVIPALAALILYGLLPVIVNTYEGLRGTDPHLVESSRTLSITPWQRLLYIRLPLASSQILAGIKTSAIIGIGTATLAAFIGAGGYGAPIVTGLSLNDMPTILIGAIPAAVMAVVAHVLFELIRLVAVPKGLRIK